MGVWPTLHTAAASVHSSRMGGRVRAPLRVDSLDRVTGNPGAAACIISRYAAKVRTSRAQAGLQRLVSLHSQDDSVGLGVLLL